MTDGSPRTDRASERGAIVSAARAEWEPPEGGFELPHPRSTRRQTDRRAVPGMGVAAEAFACARSPLTARATSSALGVLNIAASFRRLGCGLHGEPRYGQAAAVRYVDPPQA